MHLTTTDNHAFIRMNTDDSTANRGFNLKYKTLCNRTIEMNSGVIESPNFPNQYPHDYDCSWTIVVPKGNQINMQFSHFELENEGKSNNDTNVSEPKCERTKSSIEFY
jgi:cubilin